MTSTAPVTGRAPARRRARTPIVDADTHPVVRDALLRRSGELEDAVHEVLHTGGGAPDRIRGAARLLAAAIGHRYALDRHGDDARTDMEAELSFVAAGL